MDYYGPWIISSIALLVSAFCLWKVYNIPRVPKKDKQAQTTEEANKEENLTAPFLDKNQRFELRVNEKIKPTELDLESQLQSQDQKQNVYVSKTDFSAIDQQLITHTKDIEKLNRLIEKLPTEHKILDLQNQLQQQKLEFKMVQESTTQKPDIQTIQKQLKNEIISELWSEQGENPVKPNLKTLLKDTNWSLTKFQEINNEQIQNINDQIKSKINEVNEELIKIKIQLNAVDQNQQKDHFQLDSNTKEITKIWDQIKVLPLQNNQTDLQLQVQNLEQRINKVLEQSQQPDIQYIQKQIKENIFKEIQGQIDKNTKIENDRLAQFNEFKVQLQNLNDEIDSITKEIVKIWDYLKVPPQHYIHRTEQNLNLVVVIQENLERKKRVQDIIQKLYEVTNKQRYVERQFKYFVRDEQNLNELYRNYSIRSSDMKNKLSQICSSFREARGDGNCFYTSFGFQYLLIILLKFSDQEFNQFIEEQKTKQIPMKIRLTKDDEFNNQEEQLLLLDEFLYRLVQLRKIEDQQIRENTFIEHFKEFEEINNENDGCFYGLSTIFFRNIADQAVESHEFKNNIYDRFNLLIWEVECNSNEIVIDSLANYLKIYVKLLFFDNGKFREELYKPENQNQIILLIRPGHYNIGLLKQQEFQEDQGQNILVQNEHNAQQILNTNNFQQNQNENQQMY